MECDRDVVLVLRGVKRDIIVDCNAAVEPI